MQKCCDSENLELAFRCYAKPELDNKDDDIADMFFPNYNPCGTSGAIWIDKAILFGHGGCCVFAE